MPYPEASKTNVLGDLTMSKEKECIINYHQYITYSIYDLIHVHSNQE